MQTELLRIKADIAFERLRQTILRYADELKFDPNQPREAPGTREGGRWAATQGGGASAATARARAALAKRAALAAAANPELVGAAAAAAAMPAAATAVGVSRAAGLYDHYRTGRPITPFLHIPYDDPLQVELQSLSASADVDGEPYYTLSPAAQADRDADCEDQQAEDLSACTKYSEKYGGPGRPY